MIQGLAETPAVLPARRLCLRLRLGSNKQKGQEPQQKWLLLRLTLNGPEGRGLFYPKAAASEEVTGRPRGRGRRTEAQRGDKCFQKNSCLGTDKATMEMGQQLCNFVRHSAHDESGALEIYIPDEWLKT